MEFTYENQGVNTFLTWKLKQQDKLDELVKGMMENNEIPGILPLVYTRNNLDRYIKYNISSKVILKQYFSGTLGRKNVISAMISIANAIMEANEYMIETSQLLLDMEHMYINVSTAQIGLVVLPIEQKTAECNLREFFRNLVLHVQFDPNENGNYIAVILNFLNSGAAFSLVEFKKMLDAQSLENNNSGNKKNNQQPIREAAVLQSTSATSVQTPVSTEIPRPESQRKEPVKAAVPPVHEPPQKKGKFLGKTEKGRTKEKKKEKEKRGLFGKKKNKKESETAVLQSGFAVPGQEQQLDISMSSVKQMEQPVLNNCTQQQFDIAQQPAISQSRPVMQEVNTSFGETTVLSQGVSAETTVLASGANGTDLKPYILWKRKNQKVYLSKPEFRMGKEQNYVDFCVTENPSVSRSHADIITKNGAYFMRDNNSLNHTFLNGKQIKSGAEIQLEHGAKFQLANEEFEFWLY